MSRKRLTAWVLMLAVGLTARITIAAPRATVAELRAAVCCVEHCPKMPRPATTPKRCCFVSAGANDPASAAGAPSLERPASAPMALLAALPAAGSNAGGPASHRCATRRAGPPVPLITQKLRC